MADLLVDLDDAVIAALEQQARDRGMTFNDRLLEIAVAEASKYPDETPQEPAEVHPS